MLTNVPGMATDTRGRTGRRPGHPPTRLEILDAAREQFATHGYRGATVRAIAAAAGVDPALVHRHFGSKAGLFVATLEFPEGATAGVLAALQGERTELGHRLTRTYLGLWEEPATREQMAILTTAALTTSEAMEHVRGAITKGLAEILTNDLIGADQVSSFQLAMSHLLGIACVRHLTQAPPLSTMPFEELVSRVGPVIQDYLHSE